MKISFFFWGGGVILECTFTDLGGSWELFAASIFTQEILMTE